MTGAMSLHERLTRIEDKLEEIEGKLDGLIKVTTALGTSMSFRPPGEITLTDAELDKVKRDLQAAVTRPHPVERAPGAIVFGADMRELVPGLPYADAMYPLLSTCTCGRQICRVTAGTAWVYCGA